MQLNHVSHRLASVPDWQCDAQTSMSGISVSDDAVNMYYFLKAKSTVRPVSSDKRICIRYIHLYFTAVSQDPL